MSEPQADGEESLVHVTFRNALAAMVLKSNEKDRRKAEEKAETAAKEEAKLRMQEQGIDPDSMSDEDVQKTRKKIAEPTLAEITAVTRQDLVKWLLKTTDAPQLLTHVHKGLNPATTGLSFLADLEKMPKIPELSSHAVADDYFRDVSDYRSKNLYTLNMLVVGGWKFFDALEQKHPELMSLLGESEAEANQVREQLLKPLGAPSMALDKTKDLSSTQIYWNLRGQACDDTDYLILAPCFPSSLCKAISDQMKADTHFDRNTASRKAIEEGRSDALPQVSYRHIVDQQLGGAHPKNMSWMLAAQGGMIPMFYSGPPTWKSGDADMPVKVRSIFQRFGRQKAVREHAQSLQRFLKAQHSNNLASRRRHRFLVDQLITDLLALAETLQQKTPGWSLDEKFSNLTQSEKLWLDPMRASLDDQDAFAQEWLQLKWVQDIGNRFMRWMHDNVASDSLHIGDDEAWQWRRIFLSGGEDFAQQLRVQRQHIKNARRGMAAAHNKQGTAA